MVERQYQIICADGHRMPMHSWLPEEPAKAVVYIAHGMSEHARRYRQTAAALVKEGIVVYANDHRAHGQAVESPAAAGIAGVNWFYLQIEDMRLVIQAIRNAHPGSKVFLLGHSMGSFLGQRFFQLYGNEIDGLILSATNGTPDPLLPFGIGLAWLQMKLCKHHYRSRLIDLLSFQKFNKAFTPNRTQHDWLSRDPQVVDKYVADPLCGFVCNPAFFYSFFRGLSDVMKKKHRENLPANIPVYAFAGDRDPVGSFGKGIIQLQKNWIAAGIQDFKYKLYPGGRHESLNEINRQEVMGDLVGWIKERLEIRS